jgi:multidrug resistance efflux pump
MFFHSLIVTAAMTLGQAAAVADPVEEGTLASIQDVQVPAEEAGALVSLEVKEGMRVKQGMALGHIDYSRAEAELKVKKFDFDVAELRAKSKVSVDYAKKAADVAQQVYKRFEEANKNLQAVSKTDMLRYKLEWEKALLGTEKELEELKAAMLTSRSKGAELETATISLSKRTLKAPIDGVVVKVYRSVGEWVAPGDTVFRIVNVDRLKIETRLDANLYGHSDVEGKTVTVDVSLPRDQSIKVAGKVASVSPVLGVGLQLPVTVEVESPQDKNGQPVIRAGQKASLTIHLNENAPAAARTPETRGGKKAR